MIGESVSVTFIIGGSVAGSSVVKEGVGEALSVADSSTKTSVSEKTETRETFCLETKDS